MLVVTDASVASAKKENGAEPPAGAGLTRS
jgi:hypothetical protein